MTNMADSGFQTHHVQPPNTSDAHIQKNQGTGGSAKKSAQHGQLHDQERENANY